MAKSARNPVEVALRSRNIGGATKLVARGDMSERVMEREGGWKSDVYKVYARNNIDDSRRVSLKLVVASKGKERQPGIGNVK